MKESTDVLSEYESKLKKLKTGAETRGVIREAKAVADKKGFSFDDKYSDAEFAKLVATPKDFGTTLTQHLALGDEYAKRGDMERACSEIVMSYCVLGANLQSNRVKSNQVDKYVNSIEKRAERYLSKIIKSKDPKNYEYGDKLLSIAKKCKETLQKGVYAEL